MIGHRTLLATAVALLTLLLSTVPAHASSTASAAKRCRATPAVVGGTVVCLKAGQKCKTRHRKDYLEAGFVCRRVKRPHHKRALRLKPASYAQRRQGEVLDLGRSGRPTFQQALWYFDHDVAPLPGVKTPKGAVGDDPSDSGAIRSLDYFRKRLTKAQRRVLDRAMKPGKLVATFDAEGNHVDPGATTARTAAGPADMPAVMAEAIQRLRAHGAVFRHAITYAEYSRDDADDDLADTLGNWLYNRRQDCSVTFYPSGYSESLVDRRATMLHELMHCAMFESSATRRIADAQPKFIDEGLPEWAAYRVAIEWQGDIGSEEFWTPYLKHPERSLFTRSYNAAGWWALVEHEGADVFALEPGLVAIGGSGNALAVFAAARDAAGKGLEDDWGPTLAGKPDFGPRWDLKGPGQLPRQEPNAGTVTNKSKPITRSVREAGGDEFRLDLQSEVVEVTGPKIGHGAMRDAEGTDFELGSEPRKFCTEEVCVCPDGSTLDYPTIPTGVGHLGFMSEASVDTVTVKGSSVDDNCKSKSPKGVAVLGDSLIADFTVANCTKKKGTFTATAKDSGYTLRVRISPFGGFGKLYDLSYGGGSPVFTISGPGGPWSNAYNPGHNYPPLGGINFNAKGTRMALGFASTFDPSIDNQNVVGVGGALTCKYPKKPKP